VSDDVALSGGDLGREAVGGAVDGDGGGAQGPELFDDVGDSQSGLVLDVAGDGEGGEHDGQVRFDRVTGVMEDRSGREVVFGHAE
jgi:hypothetical protein